MAGPIIMLLVVVGAAAAWMRFQNGKKPGGGAPPARGSKFTRQTAAPAEGPVLKSARSRKGEFGRRSA